MNHKTTAKHFKLFQDECEKWIEYFGLKDFNIYYGHKEDDSNLASVIYNTEDRVATFYLTITWATVKIHNRAIKKAAFHEVCELLLADMYTLCCERFTQKVELEKAVHNVVHRLENTVFKDIKP